MMTTLTSMAFMNCAAGLLAIILLREKPISRMPLYTWSSVILAAACLISLVWNHFNPPYGKPAPLGEIAKTWYLFWPLLLMRGFDRLDEQDFLKLKQIFLFFFGGIAIVGIVQFFTGWVRPQGIPDTHFFHATVFLGHHLTAASVFIFPFFMLFEQNILPELQRRLLLVLGFLLLMLGFSRTLWVALPFGILARSWRTGWLFFPLGLTLFLPIVQHRLIDRIGHHERFDLWETHKVLFMQSPLVGTGLRHNHTLSGIYLQQKLGQLHVFGGHAHNMLLDMASGTGILGLISWLCWNIVVALLFWRHSKPIFWAFVVFHINGLTQVNFWDGKVQHQLALAIALAQRKRAIS